MASSQTKIPSSCSLGGSMPRIYFSEAGLAGRAESLKPSLIGWYGREVATRSRSVAHNPAGRK